MAMLVTTVLSHGRITKPAARETGPGMEAVCGKNATAIAKADNTTHIEGLPEAAAKDSKYDPKKCNFYFCKGYQFDDNKDHVQKYTAGQVVNMRAQLRILHEGKMNVSVINTATNKAIGSPLISFAQYGEKKLPKVPANNTNFDVKIPGDLKGACSKAGACVLQWYWKTDDDTYESCVDFTVS
ncbi:related to chitin binding protein [Rhynchosporium agropyri]|uniref:Related to chitin binding protein n=1 Tax=Rhynchosporium agropyri TaxID=914238 RepID=A0A1E1LR53_9HELO|nr:related to chitin binding protein [Rhynchosporium agropyri]